jgi:hypothetical protein
VHRDPRVALDQALVLEPPHPAQDGVAAAFGPDGVGEVEDEPGDRGGVARSLGVLDGDLGQPVGLAPGRRPPVELGDEVRLAPAQLARQQLPEQVVVAVPLAPVVERQHQEVAVLQLLQQPRRPRRGQRGVAQGPRHAVEDRGAGEERRLVLRHPVEDLGAQVVAHEPVVAPDAQAPIGLRAAGRQCERREVEAGGPALRALDQVVHLRRPELDPGAAQQARGLPGVHGQVVHADLRQAALGPEPGRRQGQRVARAQRQLPAVGQPEGQVRHRVQALGLGHRLQVVHDQRHRLVHGGDGRHEQRRDRQGRVGRPQRPEHARVERLDPVERGGEVGEQHDRVVVAVVGRHPARPRPVELGPLGQERGLAVAGRRHHRDHGRRAVGHQPPEQRGARHDARPGRRRPELGLQQPERGRRPPARARAAAHLSPRGPRRHASAW